MIVTLSLDEFILHFILGKSTKKRSCGIVMLNSVMCFCCRHPEAEGSERGSGGHHW